MDRLEELSNTLSNITMYDIRNMYNQVCCQFSLPYICFCWFHITRISSDSSSMGWMLCHPGEERSVEYKWNGGEGPGSDEWWTLVWVWLPTEVVEWLDFCRGASSTLMQEIAQGWVDSSYPTGFAHLTWIRTFNLWVFPSSVNSIELGLVIVNNLMRLCLVSMDGLWIKKQDSGVRYTKSVYFFILYKDIDLHGLVNRHYNYWNTLSNMGQNE